MVVFLSGPSFSTHFRPPQVNLLKHPERPEVRFNHDQRSVLRLLSRGFDAADIAPRMDLSVTRVNWHLRNCMAKAGVTSRIQLVIFVLENPQVLRYGGTAYAGLRRAAA